VSVTIGIDVGGTKIAAAVVDEDGQIVARRRIPTESGDPQAVVVGIVKVARELAAAAPAAVALGVGAAGLIDTARGVVLGAPNIAWENVALRSMLEGRVDMPVFVDNDANVAALAESVCGAGKGAGDQVMVTSGTGVGGGIIIGGEVYRGARGIGAEIGHMVVAAIDGPMCACGNRGCLETMASGSAIGRIARARADDPGAAGVLGAVTGDREAITGEVVGDAALAGDEWAQQIVAEVGGWLGIGLASLVNLLDPDIVIVGGGAAATGELLVGPARAAMNANIIGRSWRTPPPVVLAALGNDAGVIGAALLARRAHELDRGGLKDTP